MKRLIATLVLLAVVCSMALHVRAADGKVVYDGNAKKIVFEPGTEYSLTDLFPNFKDVMPGDTITQKITVKNNAADKVKVKIYLRSLGAHKDSEKFLSQLGLRVAKSEENEMAYMFDAAAHETAQLADWVYLGTLYSGGKVDLDVTLIVPVELGNEFQNKIGYLEWEFRVEEFPVEPDDPRPPQTGDNTPLGLWVGGIVLSVSGIIVLWAVKKKTRE